jgi:biotin carboxyl carrier protein
MSTFKYLINGNEYEVSIDAFQDSRARVTVNGVTLDVEIERAQQESVKIERPQVVAGAGLQPARTQPQSALGEVRAPLPGIIHSVAVKAGDPVAAGQCLLVLEAMKMENEVGAVIDGVVAQVHVAQGQNVLEGDILVSIEARA